MFSFAFGASSDTLGNVRNIAAWLDREVSSDAIVTLQRVIELLRNVPAKNAALNANRLSALLHLDGRIEPLAASLAKVHVTQTPREVRTRARYAQYDLAECFFLAYETYLERFRHGAPEKWLTAHIPVVIVRMQQYLFDQAMLRLFLYEQWIPAKWEAVHGLYLTARQNRFEHGLIKLSGEADATRATTIEREYVKTLLLLKLSSGNLSPTELQLAASFLNEWSNLLTLDAEEPPGCTWAVDTRSAQGLRSPADAETGLAVVYWDPAPVLQAIGQRLKALEDFGPSALGQLHAATLQKLAHFWAADDITARSKRKPAMDVLLPVAVGFAGVCEQLRRGSLVPSKTRLAWTEGYEYSDAGSASGLMRKGIIRERRPDYVRATDPDAERKVFWNLLDRSESGLRLSAPIEEGRLLPLGSMVALMLSGDDWDLAIVRRVQKTSAVHAEYAVEVIGTRAQLVDIVFPEGHRPAPPPVHRGPRPQDGPPPGIIFEASGQAAAAQAGSLMLAKDVYTPKLEVRLESGHSVAQIRLKSAFAAGPDWACVNFEQVEMPIDVGGHP